MYDLQERTCTGKVVYQILILTDRYIRVGSHDAIATEFVCTYVRYVSMDRQMDCNGIGTVARTHITVDIRLIPLHPYTYRNVRITRPV